MKISGDLAVSLALGAAVGLAIVLVVKKAARAGQTAVTAAKEVLTKDLNPASPDNVVNRAVTAAGAALTGDQDWSLGSRVYDLLHPLEGYQITGNPADLPWWAKPAGYGVQLGQRAGAWLSMGSDTGSTHTDWGAP